jgi:hypothetical protein
MWRDSSQEDAALLVGSTVTAVLDVSNGPEAGICVIRTKDGKHYKLCSTELGWWLDEHVTQ